MLFKTVAGKRIQEREEQGKIDLQVENIGKNSVGRKGRGCIMPSGVMRGEETSGLEMQEMWVDETSEL